MLRGQSKTAQIVGYFLVVPFLGISKSALAIIGAGVKIGAMRNQHLYDLNVAVCRRRTHFSVCP